MLITINTSVQKAEPTQNMTQYFISIDEPLHQFHSTTSCNRCRYIVQSNILWHAGWPRQYLSVSLMYYDPYHLHLQCIPQVTCWCAEYVPTGERCSLQVYHYKYICPSERHADMAIYCISPREVLWLWSDQLGMWWATDEDDGESTLMDRLKGVYRRMYPVSERRYMALSWYMTDCSFLQTRRWCHKYCKGSDTQKIFPYTHKQWTSCKEHTSQPSISIKLQ